MLRPYFLKNEIEAGCDEAGRGCLAGPVVAAAVILNPAKKIEGLNDSKKLTAKRREELAEEIKAHSLAYAIAEVDNTQIDAINILNASILGMHLAVEKLAVTPSLLLIDGNRFTPYPNIPHTCFVKGDAKFMSIAAASILAKTHRDLVMQQWHEKYPFYGWDKNAGYPTKLHREGIRKNGVTPIHRMSFQLLPKQLVLPFIEE
ncbi:MAG: ribonuclease HII [Luteibaculaceae bacterium]